MVTVDLSRYRGPVAEWTKLGYSRRTIIEMLMDGRTSALGLDALSESTAELVVTAWGPKRRGRPPAGRRR